MAGNINTNTADQLIHASQDPESTPIGSGSSDKAADQPILTKACLQALVRAIDPSVKLDEDVEELLLEIADDFMDDVVQMSSKLANNRKATKIEVTDVQVYLERKYAIWFPGRDTREMRPFRCTVATEAHKQKMALFKKATNKD